MAKNSKKEANTGYLELTRDLKAGSVKRLYAFYGEERYLLEHSLKRLRDMVPAGTESFNHHRLEGKSLTMTELTEAIDALPAFAELTLTEVSDFDLSKLNEVSRKELLDILSDIPEYACVVFVFDTVEFKLDGRVKANAELKKLFTCVDFPVQEMATLSPWIARHFKAAGKRITRDAVELLVTMTGGLMTNLNMEIEKLTAYCTGEAVTAPDVEAIVTPVLDAVAYELTDAVLSGNGDLAIQKLGELLLMNEAPHRILFSVAAKLRQLLCAKICLQNGLGLKDLMRLCDIRYDFQARSVLDLARRTSLTRCAEMVSLSADTAYKLNSSSQDDGELVREFVVRVLLMREARR